ncbi:hypothetical protein KGM48_03330 [Patescibacteria group bacterium]|nr:hypothetical protein [Patescibacteria group bacterium]
MIENTEHRERNDSISNIEQVVMRRVRLIRILLLIVSTATFAVLTGVATLWEIGREVWVARVFENMPRHGLFAEFQFWIAAFLHTRLSVEILVVLTLTSLVFLIRELVRLALSYARGG